jgi:ABC-2 type transport system ATP-binding protein
VVDAQALVVAYGDLVAVDGLDLHVEAGETLALLGRNGAGKTSTVETLEGYRRARSGTVRVLGLDPAKPEEHARLTRRMGVMLQSGGVYPAMSGVEALNLFASYYRDPEPPADLLERMDLSGVARTPWKRLSGGEQQRLSMALALVGRPDVVFLDEPTAGVDPAGRVSIREEITRLRSAGAGVILTTHELDEAERVADRVVIIDHGRVVAAGTPAELTSKSDSARRIRFSAPAGIDLAELSERIGATVREERPGEFVVLGHADPTRVAALTAWLAERNLVMTDLRVGRERLEEVFLRVTGQESGFGGDPDGEQEDRRR